MCFGNFSIGLLSAADAHRCDRLQRLTFFVRAFITERWIWNDISDSFLSDVRGLQGMHKINSSNALKNLC